MTAIKRTSLTFVIVIALLIGILPSVSYGEVVLSDAQRKALVDVTVKMVQEGNKSRILRYSQGHRMVGYNWQRIQGSKKQLTSGNVNLTNADLAVVKEILMESQGVDSVEDLYKMPTTLGYKCFFTGADIEDTIPFDCSSLCGAVYNMTVGTPYGGHAWCSGEYSKSSKWFTVTSDMSKREPGDILWKDGHVAVYLGKCFSNYTAEEAQAARVDQNKEYIAEAAGFAKIDKSSSVMRQRLLEFLRKNPQYIPEHPQFNKQKPTLQLPEDGVMDASKQVLITVYKEGRFKKVAKYIGPISAGRSIDVTNLSTTNTGNNFGSGDDSNGDGNNTSNNQTGDGSITGGASHDPINLPGNYTAVWPKDMVLEDQNLATSAGYFYKGTPTYGQYVGRIDLFNWLVNGFEDTMDWLTGFATYGFKAVLVGWAGIMESVMSNILNFGVTPDNNTEQTAVMNYDITRLEKINSAGILAYTVEDALVSRATLAGTPQISQDTNNSSGTTNGSSTNASNSNNSATNNSSNASNSNTNSSNANQATNSTAGTTTTQTPTVGTTSEIDASETKKKITIEDILFNRVPVLDINFFDFENAGGQKLSEGSLIYKIRATIAGWYTVLRNAVIIGMLVALLYTAIKIAISQPGKKAEYKSKLIDWIVGFIIVFFIHYFMVAVIAFNNQIVKVLDPVIQSKTTVDTPKVETGTNSNITTTDDGQTSLYEAIRIQAYDVKATTGIPAAIMYMVLVFLTIRFVILYAKRLFVIAVLVVISPLVGLLYSINKKKYKIGDWASEFIYNVLIQFVHVIIYTAILGFAFELTKTSTFRGGLIALMALAFMYGAEELVKKMFGFGKASTSGSLSNSAVTQLAAFGMAKKIYTKAAQNYQKSKVKLTTMNTEDTWLRRFYNNDIHKNTSVSDWVNKYNPPEDKEETEEERRNRLAQKALEAKAYKPNTAMVGGLGFRKTEYIVDKNGVPIAPYEPIDKEKGNYFNTSSINTRLEEAMKEEKKARRAYVLDAGEDLAKTFSGSFALIASVPMLVLAPKTGLGLSAFGMHALASATSRKKIEGIKQTGEKKKWTGKKLVFAWATAGASVGVENMYKNMSDKLIVFETKYTKKVELLKEARELEDKIARDIVNIELERTKNPNNIDVSNEKIKSANEKLEKVVREQEKQEFDKAVDLTVLEIDKKLVEKAVKKCMMNKEDNGFTKKDVESISKELIGKVEEKYKNLKVNSELSEIVREEVKERVIEVADYVVVDAKDKKKKRTIAEESGDTAASIREKYNRKKDDNSNDTKNKTSMFGKDMSKKITVTEEKDGETGKTTLHIKEQNEKPKKEITVEELDKVVDDVINDMKTEELIDVIDTALKRKEAIDRKVENPKLAELMKKVQELNNIHSTFKDLTGEEMYLKYKEKDKKIHRKLDDDGNEEYQSVGEVIKNMRDYLVKYINGEA